MATGTAAVATGTGAGETCCAAGTADSASVVAPASRDVGWVAGAAPYATDEGAGTAVAGAAAVAATGAV